MIGPNFLGIGAQKSGTTWIYENLSRHPHVRFPAGKEIHFWDARRNLGVTWWLDTFGPRQPGLWSGEITPAYATIDTEAIHELYALCPDLRLFYVLRNPIERAWSAARMAVLRAEMTLEEASERWFLDHFRSAGSRRRGAYAEAILRWQSVFPAEQLMVALFDDLRSQPRAFLSRLCGHIGIDAGVYAAMPEEALRQVVFEGPSAPLPPPLRRALIDQYAGPVEALAHLLGMDLSHWLAER
ncbi:sulfotransferase, putative [Nitrospirillum viridazoti Y2]|uniref:Sulfotransferase domain-containing protein n=1 Tax=Nitrospirillum amazonense TaxID=28077 RepID=A0A560INJ9_9PROT|nr:sulfotransferase [Nitrospirillum amazonense]EGX99435.1 sulfotransferase, putative [Nitrospirillum amazonense Y2]TWB60612.1 sulfotransferase domain-containing protein [Nitrospirillum amazonense]